MHNQIDIKRSVEQKAYAFGVSSAVSTLLGEYVEQLISKTYVRGNNRRHDYGGQEKQLVPKLARSNHKPI